MNTLGYIESPLQLLETIELNEQSYAKAPFYIIRDNGSARQKSQFLEVLSKKDVRDFVFYRAGKKDFIALVVFFCVFLFHFFVRKPERLSVGDARSIYSKVVYSISVIFHKDIYLVDDGLYLWSYIGEIKKRKYHIYSNLPLRGQLDGGESFTLVDRDSRSSDEVGEKSCHFIGMKLVEIGFIPKDKYIEILQGVVSENKGRDLIYYAHRGEEEGKLNEVASLGFDVLVPELPLEMYLDFSPSNCGVFYSFYSTALYNLYTTHSSSHFISLYPESHEWPDSHRQSILTCYDVFKEIGIQVREV